MNTKSESPKPELKRYLLWFFAGSITFFLWVQANSFFEDDWVMLGMPAWRHDFVFGISIGLPSTLFFSFTFGVKDDSIQSSPEPSRELESTYLFLSILFRLLLYPNIIPTFLLSLYSCLARIFFWMLRDIAVGNWTDLRMPVWRTNALVALGVGAGFPAFVALYTAWRSDMA